MRVRVAGAGGPEVRPQSQGLGMIARVGIRVRTRVRVRVGVRVGAKVRTKVGVVTVPGLEQGTGTKVRKL